MRAHRCRFFLWQRAERQKLELFFPYVLCVTQLSTCFNFSIADRIRVFTVPSGSPVFAAISECVMPSKYAHSNANRCPSGNLPITARTFSHRSFSPPLLSTLTP